MTFSAILSADLRLAVLRLLAEAAGYDLSELVLSSALAQFGHRPSGDVLRSELAWLEEQGLVTLRSAGDVQVAELTSRGADAAAGRATVPGVARPPPGG